MHASSDTHLANPSSGNTVSPDLTQLQRALGDRVNLDREYITPYMRDRSRATPEGTPLALVQARTTRDVAEALRWANAARVPVSVRGGGSGLVGGAVSYDGGLILALDAMNEIIEIDTEARTATVQAGVIAADLDAAARAHGLFYAPDPASVAISTIGGNIATNAGGLRCISHGVTADSVAELQVVLADGRILELGARTVKNVVGLDLKHLFVGSAGTLGVITQATVRLQPVHEGTPATFRANFEDITDAGNAVAHIVASADTPEVLELMDAFTVGIIEQFQPSGLTLPGAAMLIGQTVGAGAIGQAERLLDMCRAHGATETEVSDSPALVESRKLSHPALSANGLKVSCDAGVPVHQLTALMSRVQRLSQEWNRDVSIVAHAGDGNIHANVRSSEAPEDRAEAERLIDEITRAALELGGTISGEHGIGSVKHHELSWQLSDVALEVQRTIKVALDPHQILTPGREI